ncbi:hypothetical protein [Faecalibacillus faecis]|uniref:hypothetical protein n=1 Tax=Faecalibacillus faecis TaxID=1982628 RepID=UPI003868E7EC
MDIFKKGDKVKMIDCAGALADPDKIWICSSNEYINKDGVRSVKILGVTKYTKDGFPCSRLILAEP